ncbi:hypothetical protein [Marinitenerispora sediminis]|uniref:Uncharacterized protein n=1 Tax=Marinitenerispora sediminis TaxID=1931232 RepID=A0A368T066_9ACTN|nr:hypothetical protein [Marinitenerispora sediminis]RCV49125.1 hypothetical protein DEF28_21745 [Marinitenerispora sediminis]RCV51881.1 hypothetical protein DEF24_22710 [Marinitenerispora sediminis]RCV57240.1 hypothetical protein DEF23_11150 [Marinitenerispora sediminis]
MTDDGTEPLVTLKEWAARHGYSHDYVVHVMPRYYEDFPAPEQPRRGVTEKGGGGGSALYNPKKLEPFRPRRPDPVELSEEDLRREVTLVGFAKLIGVDGRSVTQIKEDRPDTLPDTVDGQRWYPRAKYRARDLLKMWNSRPGRGQGSDKRRGPRSWAGEE